ncbi:MAG: ankyrin repeat domain-containing protein [Myxococcota bacterium]
MGEVAAALEAITAGDAGKLRDLVTRDPSLSRARDASGVSLVMSAMYHGKRELADILAAGGDLDVFEATALGNTARVASLVGKDASLVKAVSPDGFTALHFAAFFGRAAVAEVLLQHGADVHAVARNPMQVQPLHSAASAGHRAVMEVLLKAGANVNARQQAGWTPLQARALHGDVEGVRLLLRHGADASLQADNGSTAADLAREKGHPDVVALLTRG